RIKKIDQFRVSMKRRSDLPGSKCSATLSKALSILHILCMANSPKKTNRGFEEQPQPPLTGTPLTGPVSDWAEKIAREAEKPAKPTRRPKPDKSRKEQDGGTQDELRDGKNAPARKTRIPKRSAAPGKTARGTSMGGAASARERAAAGLMPIAGLDVTLEEAEGLTQEGVTA